MKNRNLLVAGALGALILGSLAISSNPELLQGKFDTSPELTRAEVTKAIVEQAFGAQTEACDDFPDVPATDPYNPYICAAVTYGIIDAYDDGLFSPDSLVTRAEAAKLVYTAFDLGYECELPQLYRDVRLGEWYTEYVNDIGIQGVYGATVRFGNAFRPSANITEDALEVWLTNV